MAAMDSPAGPVEGAGPEGKGPGLPELPQRSVSTPTTQVRRGQAADIPRIRAVVLKAW